MAHIFYLPELKYFLLRKSDTTIYMVQVIPYIISLNEGISGIRLENESAVPSFTAQS